MTSAKNIFQLTHTKLNCYVRSVSTKFGRVSGRIQKPGSNNSLGIALELDFFLTYFVTLNIQHTRVRCVEYVRAKIFSFRVSCEIARAFFKTVLYHVTILIVLIVDRYNIKVMLMYPNNIYTYFYTNIRRVQTEKRTRLNM